MSLFTVTPGNSQVSTEDVRVSLFAYNAYLGNVYHRVSGYTYVSYTVDLKDVNDRDTVLFLGNRDNAGSPDIDRYWECSCARILVGFWDKDATRNKQLLVSFSFSIPGSLPNEVQLFVGDELVDTVVLEETNGFLRASRAVLVEADREGGLEFFVRPVREGSMFYFDKAEGVFLS